MGEKRPTIYMIGDDGGAMETNNPKAAARFKALLGYKECSKQEYDERLRWQEQEDAKVVSEKQGLEIGG